MKKIIAVLIALQMIFALSGCSRSAPHAPRPENSAEEQNREDTKEPSAPVPEEETVEEMPEETESVPAEIGDVDVSTLPESLVTFLIQFNGWYRDVDGLMGKHYDSVNASDGSSNIMMNIVANGSCVDFRLYPGKGPEYHWGDGTTDPRNWSAELGAYAVFDGETVDWIAKNIFNITDRDIAALVRQGEELGEFYMEGDDGSHSYYVPIGGVGDPFITVQLTSATFDGVKYYVNYGLYTSIDGTPEELIDSYYTVVELKNIDGGEYWSMYSHDSTTGV